MGELTRVVKVDGEELDTESTRAYELVARETTELMNRLEQYRAAVPMRLRDDYHGAWTSLSELRGRAARVATEARRREELGRSTSKALAEALAEAEWIESKR